MLWPGKRRKRELREQVERERALLREDLKVLGQVEQERSFAHRLVAHMPRRRELNTFSEGLEELYRKRRRF